MTVSAPATAPVVTIAPAPAPASGRPFTLRGSATTDGATIPLFTWSQVSGPGTAVFATPAAAASAVTLSQPGVWVLRLTATSGDLSGSADVTVTVADALPPVVSLTSPLPQTEYALGDPIPIAAEASSPAGSIAKVEFYADGQKIGECCRPLHAALAGGR